mmetsp:Transcript_8572/g.22154  ORF Transcript_8572/g.22154 Transcript_8572/m.22154 type:complete len:254 (+) Transcript_8572:73-834(+)
MNMILAVTYELRVYHAPHASISAPATSAIRSRWTSSYCHFSQNCFQNSRRSTGTGSPTEAAALPADLSHAASTHRRSVSAAVGRVALTMAVARRAVRRELSAIATSPLRTCSSEVAIGMTTFMTMSSANTGSGACSIALSSARGCSSESGFWSSASVRYCTKNPRMPSLDPSIAVSTGSTSGSSSSSAAHTDGANATARRKSAAFTSSTEGRLDMRALALTMRLCVRTASQLIVNTIRNTPTTVADMTLDPRA